MHDELAFDLLALDEDEEVVPGAEDTEEEGEEGDSDDEDDEEM